MLNVEHRRVRSSIFFREIFYRHALEHSNRFVQNAALFFSPPPGESPNFIEKMKACNWSILVSLAPRDNPWPLNTKEAMSPSSNCRGGQYGTKYSPFD